MKSANPLSYLFALVVSLAILAYVAAGEWSDRRKARKAGQAWEGEE